MRCLTPKEIADLSSGTLLGLERLEAEEHISDCDSCRSAFQQFRSSSQADQTIALPRGLQSMFPSGVVSASGSEATVANDQTIATTPGGGNLTKVPRIDGYSITGVLGQGGMGIVYRAVQTKLSRTVALKVLPSMIGSASPAAVHRFRREATAAARLHHTNIIPIYDFGESEDAHYYAMELVTGEPLNDLIRRFAEKGLSHPTAAQLTQVLNDHSMPVHSPGTGLDQSSADGSSDEIAALGQKGRSYFRRVARWISDAAEALNYAHAQGIIHRDIKPANLILSNDGRIMLADFGLAKSAGEQSVTRTGAMVGTLRYMSPEQTMAKRVKIDHRTDIYSLGATFYELLCFRPAFPGVDESEILSAIIGRDPQRPRKLNPHVPAELETICMKCLEKMADARYESGKALADDLRRFLNDLPIVAKRPNVFQRTFKFVRRHKAPVIAVTMIVLLVVAVLFWTKEKSARRQAEIRSLYDSAQTYVSSNRWDRAKRELDRAVRLDPTNPETLLVLAWFHLEHYKFDPVQAGLPSQEEAVAACRKILAVDPNNIRALGYMGNALRRLGRAAEAIEPMERARQLDPTIYAYWSNLGTLYAATGDLDKAETYMRKGTTLAGLAEDKWHAAVWRNLAALDLFLRKDEAMTHINNALRCSSADGWSWVLKARAHMELPNHLDLQVALDDAKHADRLGNPIDRNQGVAGTPTRLQTDAKAKRVLALAYLRNGDFVQAAREARQAIDLGDEASINQLILACAAKGQGNADAQAEALREAHAAWPETLKTPGAFIAIAHTGDLWIDSADERLELARQAGE